TIMPLIINTHGHLGLTKGTTQSAANQTDDNFRRQLLTYQEYGVGAVPSMGFTQVFRPETPAEARSEVAQQVSQKPDFIKVWVDDFWGQYPKMPPEIYGEIG